MSKALGPHDRRASASALSVARPAADRHASTAASVRGACGAQPAPSRTKILRRNANQRPPRAGSSPNSQSAAARDAVATTNACVAAASPQRSYATRRAQRTLQRVDRKSRRCAASATGTATSSEYVGWPLPSPAHARAWSTAYATANGPQSRRRSAARFRRSSTSQRSSSIFARAVVAARRLRRPRSGTQRRWRPLDPERLAQL
mmetsp:Transcript_3377/g.10018  ORF Transcript_3377/g.10018 Transcript_3377/m.10018 type:complete len:204 (-) Transcript_3377:70-681(-)